MTYQNDPNRDFDRPMDPVVERRIEREGWGMGSVILASLAALAVVFGLFYAIANRGDDTATATRIDNRPAVTTTAPANNPPAARETTGSGAIKPAPAPAPAPATPNR